MSTKYFKGNSFETIYLQILTELQYNAEFTGEARGVQFSEIVNLSFELTNPFDRFVWNKARNANYEFAMRFFLWMANGADDYDYVAGINPNAANYIDQKKLNQKGDTSFSTAYGPRIMRQLPNIIEELKRDRGSRRAVISILDEKDLEMLGTGTKEEFPCIESLTFFIRENKFHCHCQMRSNNMATTVVYDVFCFTMFQEMVWKILRQLEQFIRLEMGSYFHHCTSAHYFKNQNGFVYNILESKEIQLSRADGGQKKHKLELVEIFDETETLERKVA